MGMGASLDVPLMQPRSPLTSFCVALAYALLVCAATPLLADKKPAPAALLGSVFHISKSENKNEVHYAVQIDTLCRPFGERPVYGYWREFEEGPRTVAPLLHHELPAYGLNPPRSIERSENGGRVMLSLRGFPERVLTVETYHDASGCHARALTTILKQPAVLDSIYVKIGFLFSVDYAIVRGQRLADGSPVQEKIDE